MRTDFYYEKKWDYILYSVFFAAGMLLTKAGYAYFSGTVLIIGGLVLYILNFLRTGNLVDIRGLFSLSWICGIGIACLKLSNLQREWENITWLCFFCAYFFFLAGYDLTSMKKPERIGQCVEQKQVERNEKTASRLLICMVLLAAVSVACFILEAVVVGFIPLFSPEPHAYSYFHVSGVHYFTISCILIPALAVLYTKVTEKVSAKVFVLLIVLNVIAAAIPILCVSRFQLLFAAGFAEVTYLMLYRKITWKMVVGAVLILIPVYVLLTVARRHDVAYLNGIFEMKSSTIPIFITQPYIYIANNFENFNCLVAELPAFTKGLRMLFPIFALTGLKFVFPQLAAFPLYITKTELTTLTMFYDAYYDFGVPGIILFAAVLGMTAAIVTGKAKTCKNPVVYLFYGQLAIYFGLAFFAIWFSVPTTWFWFAVTAAIYLFVGWGKKSERNTGDGKEQDS